MVTILAVVVDPFVQQIAHYYTCAQVAHSYEAFIPRVNSYQDNEAVRQGAGIQTLGAGTQAAISAGSFSASAFNLPFICPTGNCTFQTPYLSVGYCSSCSDISTELRTVNYTYLSNNSAGINVPEWQLNYTLPSGLYLVADGATLAVGGYYNNSDSPLAPIAIVEVMYEAPQLSGAIRNCTQDDPCTPDDTWVRGGYGAARCEIGACVKEYAATVQSGILVSDPQTAFISVMFTATTCLF